MNHNACHGVSEAKKASQPVIKHCATDNYEVNASDNNNAIVLSYRGDQSQSIDIYDMSDIIEIRALLDFVEKLML